MTSRLVAIALAFVAFVGPAARSAADSQAACDDLIKLVFPEMHEDPETGPTEFGPSALPVRRFAADDEIRVRNLATGRDEFTFEPEADQVTGLAFAPDGTGLAVATVSGQVLRLYVGKDGPAPPAGVSDPVLAAWFNDLAAEFDNTRAPLRSAYTDITSACGELSSSVDAGASKFLLSWNDVFDVCSTESALIAGNVNRFRVDLEALDRDARTSIQL